MNFPDGPMQDGALVTDVLGEKCPDCGWRRDQHKPGGDLLGDACPRWQAWAEASARGELWDASQVTPR